MLQYPSHHASLRSTLATSTIRIDEKGDSSATIKRWHLKSRRAYLVAATLVIVGAGFFVGAYAFHFFGPQNPNCWTRPPDAPNTAAFTVVIANQGANGGGNGRDYHPAPRPVMNVTHATTVLLPDLKTDTR